MSDIDRVAVERVFEQIALVLAGEEAGVGFAALTIMIAGQASVAASSRVEARKIIDMIATDAKSQMRKDFDWFRETAQPVGGVGLG